MSTLRVCETCAAIFDEPLDRCPRDDTPLEDARDGRVGTTIGRYVLVRRLGRGVRGYVYLGMHPVIRSRVAIKILHSAADEESDGYKRFVIEAQAVNRIEHPNIIRVMDMAVLPDQHPYILMEYLEGHSLREEMLAGQLEPDAAYDVIQQVLAGLQAAHDADFVHRDLKPRNIYVTESGEVKILDFGIAKLIRREWTPITQTGMILGTPMYIAPEQALGKKDLVGPWTDIYSVGVMLYELFTGAQPFDAQTSSAILVSHINDLPVPPRERFPEIIPELEQLILWCLEKAPADRPQSCRELSEALEDVWLGEAPAFREALSSSTLPAVDATVDATFDAISGVSGRFSVERGDPTDPSGRHRSTTGPGGGRPSGALSMQDLMQNTETPEDGAAKGGPRLALLLGLGLLAVVGVLLGVFAWDRWSWSTSLGRLDTQAASARRMANPPRMAPASTDILRVLQTRGVSTLDPLRATHPSSISPIQQMHESLVRYDRLTGQLQPLLALSWKQRGQTMELKLRKNVVFHDGAPLTAQAVVASLKRSIASPLGKAFLWDVQTVTATGPRGVQIRLRHRSVSFLMRLALWTAAVTRPGASHPIGTGPFRVKSWDRRSGTLTLVPHQQYWGRVPSVGRVIFSADQDLASQAARLRRGEAHVLTDVPAALAAKLRRDRAVQVLTSPGQIITYLYFNTQKPYLRSAAIRRALSKAIHRERFVKRLYGGSAKLARTSLPTGLAHSLRRCGWPAPNPVRAAAQLAGKPVTKRRLLLYLPISAKSVLPNPKLAAKQIVHDLAAVGVEVNAVFTSPTRYSRIIDRGEFDLTYGAWRLDYPDPENIYFLATRRALAAKVNNARYSDPTLERLVNAARTEQNRNKRLKLFGRIERHLAKKQPWLPMAQLPAFIVHRTEVSGIEFERSLNVSLSLSGIRFRR